MFRHHTLWLIALFTLGFTVACAPTRKITSVSDDDAASPIVVYEASASGSTPSLTLHPPTPLFGTPGLEAAPIQTAGIDPFTPSGDGSTTAPIESLFGDPSTTSGANASVARAPRSDLERGQTYARRGAYDKAEPYLWRAVQREPENLEAWQWLIQALMETEQYTVADQALTVATQIDPDNMEMILDRARVRWAMRHEEEAVGFLNQCKALAPDDQQVLAEMSGLFLEMKRYDSTLDIYERMMNLDPQSPDNRRHIAELTDVFCRVAAEILDTEHSDRVIPLSEKILTLNPDSVEARRLIAQAHEKAGRWEEALDYYRKVTDLAPDQPRYRIDLGRIHEKLGQHEWARQAYQDAITFDSQNLVGLFYLASVLERMEKGNVAQTLYDKAAGLAPRNFDERVCQGQALLATEQPYEALDVFRRCVRENPTDANAHAGLGQARYKTGDTEGADKALLKAIELDPQLPHAHYTMGLVAMGRGDTARAEASLQTLQQLDVDLAATLRAAIKSYERARSEL